MKKMVEYTGWCGETEEDGEWSGNRISGGLGRTGLDAGLGERDTQVGILGQFVIVHSDESVDGGLDVLELAESHLVVFSETLECRKIRNLHDFLREELECLDCVSSFCEHLFQFLLSNTNWNVGEMKGGTWWVDVQVVFGSWLLEAVQSGVSVVPSKTGIRLSLLWHLNIRVLRRSHTDHSVVPFDLVKVCQCWNNKLLSSPRKMLTELRLLRLRVLNKSIVLLVVQDLDPHHISVDP